jgi:uncharacterized DUF497 family protein
MAITFDARKREWTLIHRAVDFVHAEEVFAGDTFTQVDDRCDYANCD